MKGRVWLILLILLCCVACEEEGKNTDAHGAEEKVQYWTYSIGRFEIENTYVASGEVVSGQAELYERSYVVEKKDMTSGILVQAGEEMEMGQVLYTGVKESVTIDYPAKVVSVQETEEEYWITLLDYSHLYIVSELPYEMYVDIDYDTEVEIESIYDVVTGVISYIDYEISDGRFEVRVDTSARLLPGESVEVTFHLNTYRKALYIPDTAVIKLGDFYYCDIMGDDNELVRVQVELGDELFTEKGEDIDYVYYEVLSGLEEGDVIYVKYGESFSLGERLDGIEE